MAALVACDGATTVADDDGDAEAEEDEDEEELSSSAAAGPSLEPAVVPGWANRRVVELLSLSSPPAVLGEEEGEEGGEEAAIGG